jgi:capsular polysaccharide biosynthesis protein
VRPVSGTPEFLALSTVRDALVVARPVLDDWSGGAGVLRRSGATWRYVRGSGIARYGRRQIVAPRTDGHEPLHEVEAAVFGGYLFDHYGHFLMESLARLWAPSPEPPVPVVWIAGWTESFSPWMSDVLDVVGVADDRIVVTSAGGPLRVGELLVAEPGFEFGSYMHPWFARRLARRCVVPAPAGHVWLSRSVRAPISGLDEEAELEARLADCGWLVVHPEDLSVAGQLDVLAHAVHVAGLEGSAFHTLALLDGFAGAVDVFTRQEHVNFELVAEASGFDQVRHRLPGAVPRERQKVRGVDVQWGGVDIAAALDILHARCDRHGHPRPLTSTES